MLDAGPDGYLRPSEFRNGQAPEPWRVLASGSLLARHLGIERTVRTFSAMAATLASVAVTFGLRALSYRYLEKPLIEFAHRRFRF
jgi:peptidoglycan/LPS O-acetylase OafA/YrhL